MSTVPEAVGPAPAAPAADPRALRGELASRARALAASPVAWALGVYLASRVAYLLVALVDVPLRGWQLSWEVSNWDGFWYQLLVWQGYPHTPELGQSTLGFLPLYPMLIWALQHALPVSRVVAGMLISTAGGAAATVLIGRLCARWWEEATARRAVLFLCLFPGSIVFSMLYTEGIMLAFVAGSLLALERRRWVAAGVLAALATATGPAALALVPACAVAAMLELRRRGLNDRRAWRALAAPALAPLGLAAFAIYLWAWTGTPLASFRAQRYGWHESSTPLALLRAARRLVDEIAGAPNLTHSGINLNYIAGLLGAVFLACGLVLLWRERRRVSLPALVWAAGVGLLAVTSQNTPPNPRMLLVAFPVVVVFAARLRGRAYARLLAGSTVVMVAMSLITFVGTGLRP